MIVLALPLGPTVNHYYKRSGHRTYLPKTVFDYRQAVAEIVADAGYATITGRVELFAVIHPRSKRKTDLDNYSKAMLDALTHAGVWLDDEQIDYLAMARGDVIKNGLVKLIIRELT